MLHFIHFCDPPHLPARLLFHLLRNVRFPLFSLIDLDLRLVEGCNHSPAFRAVLANKALMTSIQDTHSIKPHGSGRSCESVDDRSHSTFCMRAASFDMTHLTRVRVNSHRKNNLYTERGAYCALCSLIAMLCATNQKSFPNETGNLLTELWVGIRSAQGRSWNSKSVMPRWLWRQFDNYLRSFIHGNQFRRSNCCFTLKILFLSVPSITEIEEMVPKMSKVFTADTLQRVACRPPRGRPQPEVWWEREGQRVPTEGRVYQDGLDLVFSPTEGGDSGTYTCVAQNKAGRKTQEVTFTVASELCTVHLKGPPHWFYILGLVYRAAAWKTAL